MSDEGLPRLPPKVERVEFELDVSKVEPHELILKPDWAPFPEPALLATRRVRPAMVVARSLLFIWSATLLVAAFVARSNALDSIDRGTTIRIVGWSGVLVAAVFAALGWRWSDRKTQNLHMLEARLPTRFWCARAWVAPFLWFGVLAGTILQLGPGELLDVRPAIAVPIFAAALWRPYALVRRIVASLIRVRFDPLIGTAYVLDLTAFGLLWWQLWTFPDFIVSSNSGSIDVLIGVSAAATVAFGANVVVWILLLRNVERAQAHRLIAVRTRHDHRQLRLRGIDPMDREVRWALLKIKAARDEERAAATAIAAGAARAKRRGAPEVVGPADIPTPEVAEAPTVVESPFAGDGSITREPIVRLDGGVEDAHDRLLERLDGLSQESELEPELSFDTATADGEEAAAPNEVEAVPADTERDAVAARAASDAGTPVSEASDTDEPDTDEPESELPERPVGRLAERLRAHNAPRLADQPFVLSDPLDESRPRTLEHLGQQTALFGEQGLLADSGESLLRRLEAFGITPGPAVAEPVGGRWSGSNEPDEAFDKWVLPRLYGLEMARYLFVLAVVAVVTASVWITYRSVSIGGQLVAGTIRPVHATELNTSRRVVVLALGIAATVSPLWCGVLSLYARRAGVPRTHAIRAFALFVVALALSVLAFVLDGSTRGTPSLMFLIGSVVAAVAASMTLAPVQRWFDLPPLMSAGWSVGLAVLVGASWIGGLQHAVSGDDAIDTLTFFAALLTIVAAVLAVIVTLSTSDIVDEIKLASARTDAPPDDGGEAPVPATVGAPVE